MSLITKKISKDLSVAVDPITVVINKNGNVRNSVVLLSIDEAKQLVRELKEVLNVKG